MKTFHLTFKSLLAICSLCFSINMQAQLAGNYTIDANSARSNSNFQSFNGLTAALDSHGVSAPIAVDVVVGSGPYTEQVLFTTYTGVSAVNTITINGNGETLGFNQSTNHGRVNSIDSSKHITIDSLHIQTGHDTYGIGIHFMRHADSNTIKNCIIDLSSIRIIGWSFGLLFMVN